MTTPEALFGLPLPGGTSVSHLRVYDTVGPDGLAGGSPHLHTVCTEAYLVIAGEGLVQTLSGEGYGETPLVAGTIAWFAPGTVHRLVNLDGRLEIFVVMANAGLPEAGDMVLAFEPEVLTGSRYRTVADLPAGGTTTDGSPDPARRRRDLAVAGFNHWRDRVTSDGPAALDDLYRAAVDLVGERAGAWAPLLDRDPAVDLARSRAQVAALADGTAPATAAAQLAASRIRSTSLVPAVRRMGCCGTLGTVIH